MVILLSLITALKSQEPVFRLKDLDNQWKEYEDLKGDRLTVIDFWATWCQPCARSIPLLNEMAEEFDPQGVKFIGVSIDGTRNQSKIQPFIASMGVEYAIIRDIDSELMSELSVTAVPTLMSKPFSQPARGQTSLNPLLRALCHLQHQVRYLHPYLYPHLYSHIYPYTYLYPFRYVYTYTYTHICTCISIRICLYMYIYIYNPGGSHQLGLSHADVDE